MIGISIKPGIGLGDSLQFSSLPENYFLATGEKLVDISRPWFFDYNPYVIRDDDAKPDETIELWNFGHENRFAWVNPRIDPERRAPVYTCNAEVWAAVLGVPVSLNRPRLYRFEDYPFEQRGLILLHVDGRTQGTMPGHVIEHVLRKYGGTKRLYQIGGPDAPCIGIPKIETPTPWELARVVSSARMLIGMDSGPAWVGACFPDLVIKKLRAIHSIERLREWIPLEIKNVHSFWDDRCHQVYNPFDKDAGFTNSYKRI